MSSQVSVHPQGGRRRGVALPTPRKERDPLLHPPLGNLLSSSPWTGQRYPTPSPILDRTGVPPLPPGTNYAVAGMPFAVTQKEFLAQRNYSILLTWRVCYSPVWNWGTPCPPIRLWIPGIRVSFWKRILRNVTWQPFWKWPLSSLGHEPEPWIYWRFISPCTYWRLPLVHKRFN